MFSPGRSSSESPLASASGRSLSSVSTGSVEGGPRPCLKSSSATSSGLFGFTMLYSSSVVRHLSAPPGGISGSSVRRRLCPLSVDGLLQSARIVIWIIGRRRTHVCLISDFSRLGVLFIVGFLAAFLGKFRRACRTEIVALDHRCLLSGQCILFCAGLFFRPSWLCCRGRVGLGCSFTKLFACSPGPPFAMVVPPSAKTSAPVMKLASSE